MNIKQEQEIIAAIQQLQLLVNDSTIASFDKENIRESLADIQRVYLARIGYKYTRLIEQEETLNDFR